MDKEVESNANIIGIDRSKEDSVIAVTVGRSQGNGKILINNVFEGSDAEFVAEQAQTIERQAAEIERLRCDSPTSLIFRVVAEIREEFGVGYKPMLEDLPSILKQQIEVYKLGLRNARFDISKASEVVWRQSSVPETTFDYIGRIIGDELTWEEWQSRQSKGTHHE